MCVLHMQNTPKCDDGSPASTVGDEVFVGGRGQLDPRHATPSFHVHNVHAKVAAGTSTLRSNGIGNNISSC